MLRNAVCAISCFHVESFIGIVFSLSAEYLMYLSFQHGMYPKYLMYLKSNN
jgi:hypothetical protein